MPVYNEFEVYIPSLSSIELAEKHLVGGVMHYFYFITYNLTAISTQYLDYNDDGTNVELTWYYKPGMTIIGGEGFNSAQNEQSSMTFYVESTGGGYIKLQTHNKRGDTLDSLGDFETGYVYLAPDEPSLTAVYTHYINTPSCRRISADATAVSGDYLNAKMRLVAHYYDTYDDIKELDLGEVTTTGNEFVFEDYNNYNASHLYYTAIVTQYNNIGENDFNFASEEATITLSPYIQPYPAVIYGQRTTSGQLAYVEGNGLHIDWTFMSRDGSEQQSFSVTIRETFGPDLVTKTGGSEQYCDFTDAELSLGGSMTIILSTYGLSADPAITTDYIIRVPEPQATVDYSYSYAEQLINIEAGNARDNDELQLSSYVAIKDLFDNVLWSGLSSVYSQSGKAAFTVNINEIPGYDASQYYMIESKIFSNIIEGYVDVHEDIMTLPGFASPSAPEVSVSIIDDFCIIDIDTDENTAFVDVFCRYHEERVYIAQRAPVIDGHVEYRFNTPPIAMDFIIQSIAYGHFYTSSEESDGAWGFIPCRNFAYINYLSSNDREHSKYIAKFGVKMNARFGVSVSNNLEKYNIIGKYDAVTKSDGNAVRTISLEGDVEFTEEEMRDFALFSQTAMKCIVRIPRERVYYCYISSADIKKNAGSRNASVSIKMNVDSSIESEQIDTYSPCEATLIYAEQVLSSLM